MAKNKITDNLWKRYKRTRAVNLRNLLIEKYLHIARYHASRLAELTPSEVQYDDLYSDGVLGLLDAVERFDPDKNIKFKTYAAHRVRGAIQDGLRNRDHVPRWVRSSHAKFTKQIESIQQKLGYRPHEDELRKRMNISRVELARRYKSFGRIPPILSINTTIGTPISQSDFDNAPAIYHTLKAANQKSHETSRREFTESQWLRGLSHEDKLILVLYYYEGLNQREIGEVIGISESGVSQKHNDLLERFRRLGLGVNNG